jgi:exocyst complex component 3
MLGKPALQIEVGDLLAERALLDAETIARLYDRYLQLTATDVSEWMSKTLTTEKDVSTHVQHLYDMLVQDWYKSVVPERDGIGQAYTSLPSILFQMLEDQVLLAKEITVKLIADVVALHVTEMLSVATRYRDAIMAFKAKHFEDRSRFTRFTACMVSIRCLAASRYRWRR